MDRRILASPGVFAGTGTSEPELTGRPSGIGGYDPTAMDMWSAGIVIAQLEFATALFDKDKADLQIQAMIEFLGPPEPDWPEVTARPLRSQRSSRLSFRQPSKPPRIALACPQRVRRPRTEGHPAIDLTMRLLKWNPSSRLTAAQALEHEHVLQHYDSIAIDVEELYRQCQCRAPRGQARSLDHRKEPSGVSGERREDDLPPTSPAFTLAPARSSP
jgi:serine/threonine protein kinase